MVGEAAKPSASGSATAAATSTASTPVVRSDRTSSPLRTARAASGSTSPAVRVASTSSATDWVTRTPSSAGERARLRGHRRGQLPPLLGERPQLGAVHALLRLAQRGADRQHLLDLGGLAAYQQVDDPGRHRRLAERLERGDQLLVALGRLGPRVALRGEPLQRQRVELVGDLEQRGRSSRVLHLARVRRPLGALLAPGRPPAEVLVETAGPVVLDQAPQPTTPGRALDGPSRQPAPPPLGAHRQVPQQGVASQQT